MTFFFKEDIKDFEDYFIDFVKTEKKRIYKIARIAEKIENSDMNDMKWNESIGEYTNRRLKKRKLFMEDYNYFVNQKTPPFLNY